MPKHKSGTLLDSRDSDPFRDRISKVKTMLILGASAILLCFNLGDRNSFQTLSLELEEIKGMDIGKCKVYLVGCKSDL